MVTKKSFYSKIYKNKFMGYPNGVIADGLVFLSGIFGNDQNDLNKNFDKIPLQGRDKKQGYFVADEREATVALDSWSVHNQINELLKEIGTDENLGDNFAFNSISDIQKEIDYFTSFCDPNFFVVQTGSWVMEINQVGNFNEDFSMIYLINFRYKNKIYIQFF